MEAGEARNRRIEGRSKEVAGRRYNIKQVALSRNIRSGREGKTNFQELKEKEADRTGNGKVKGRVMEGTGKGKMKNGAY